MKEHIIPSKLDWNEGRVKGFQGKDLLLKPNGSIKLVTISPLAKYPIHIHPDKTEYAYVLKGEVICTLDDEETTVSKDEFMIFPKNRQHGIKNNLDAETVLIIGSIME